MMKIKLANYGAWDTESQVFTHNPETVEKQWKWDDGTTVFKAKSQRWNHLIVQEDWGVRLIYDGMGSSYRNTDYRFDGIVEGQVGNVLNLRTEK